MAGDGSDEYGDQFELETFFRRVLSVTEPRLRRRQVERHFTTVDAETVAAHLQQTLELSVAGDSRANELLFSVGEFVHTVAAPEALALEAVDLVARRNDQHGVAWFLMDPPPARVIEDRALARMASQSQSLGHRRSAAAQADPRALERLLLDDHPMVIERLCQNPRVLETHVMTIVTRRPTLPVLIATVAAHPKWFRNPRVREGIVNNPYGPTGLALRALPTLTHSQWAAIRHASQVHATVRGFAEYLCNVREGRTDGPSPSDLAEPLH